MDRRQPEEMGESLRTLGHERREVVEQITADIERGVTEATRLYGDLDRISERCMDLLQRQRDLIADQLKG